MTTFEPEFAQGNLNKAEIRKLNQKYEFLNFFKCLKLVID